MERINLHAADFVIISIYLLLTLLIGFHHSRKKYHTNVDSYLLAGRRISLPAFTATLVSTWYGGILGIGEFTWLYGLLNWTTQALPYYLFAIIFALFLAPKIQQSKRYTIPDILYDNYGKKTGFLGSILIFFLVTPAPHLLMVMLILSSILGIPLIWAYLVAIVFSLLYVYFGGLQSVVRTDVLQFILMFFGFIILVSRLVMNYGGADFLAANLPVNHLRFTGEMGLQYVMVWFFIALWTFVDPGFYQRCYAAKTPQVARNGILLAVAFWIVFDMLTTLAGLYARALLTDINPVMAFPRLGEMVLPPVYLGIFIVGMLATVMSTLDSTAFLSAVTFGRDLLWRIFQKDKIKEYTRIGLFVSIAFSTVLVVILPSVVKMWYTLGSILIPALLLPVVLTFFRLDLKISDKLAVASVFFSFFSAFLWFIIGAFRGTAGFPRYLYNIQPFYIGLLVALLILIIGYPAKDRRG